MKFFLYLFSAVIIAGFIVYEFGWYPVASVNGTLIFARAWQRAINAERRVINAHAFASHSRQIDFSSPKNAELFGIVRKNMLTFLIDSEIMAKEGAAVVPDLGQLSIQRLNDELSKSKITEQTASAVYGLDVALLKEMVLLPQAQQEILSQTLEADGKNFDDWLSGARGQAKVRFFFHSFQWDQNGIK
ncbi:MAG: hypothetical protein HY617_03200 [Candidatus Sungbacteria bacterium]|nr:hypothetical protein [Candidatus Sungbacteria bacterium]